MRISPELFEEFRTVLGDRVTLNRSARDQHASGESWHPPGLPDFVAFPRDTDEVSRVVRLCHAHHIPVVAFGAGTSIEGQVNAVQGGLSLDTREMCEILAVRPADMDATVQAGMTRKALNAALNGTGLAFTVDPGADASLGGMAATRASGTNSVRYGTMAENVLAMTAVMADGRVIRTGTRARKSAAGYDLTHLLLGSEGTLGIITELTVRLHGLPEALSAATCAFPDIQAACQATIAMLHGAIPVARSELLDQRAIQAINRHAKMQLAELPSLFLEFHGTPAGVAEQAERAGEIAAEYGGTGFKWATHQEDRSALWQARHEAFYAACALRPGAGAWSTDVCVPIGELSGCIAETLEQLAGCRLPYIVGGHVGDGNYHVLFLVDRAEPAELEECERINKAVVAAAHARGGTCSGEHGIGFGKLAYMEAEHGEALEVMRAIKVALDPLNILNPGKLLPDYSA